MSGFVVNSSNLLSSRSRFWSTGETPTFSLLTDNSSNGVDQLDANLTINGITVAPLFRYKGGDADATNWDAWGYGCDLDLQAGTAPYYNQGSPLFGSANDDSVKLNAGGFYLCSETTCGDITTEDFVFETIFKFRDETTMIAAKATAPPPGWQVYTDTNNRLTMRINEGGNTANVVSLNDSLVTDSWNHCIFFGDRSNAGIWYVNGTQSGIELSLTTVGDITSTEKLAIGARSNGTLICNHNIAYVAMWKRDNWLDTHLQATVAQERFLRLSGLYPYKATGTAAPTTITRATGAHLDKLESNVRKVYLVGNNWLRVCQRKDSDGDTMAGYLSEVAATNTATYSDDLSNYTLIRVTTADGYDSPDKNSTADSIEEDGTSNSNHYIYLVADGNATLNNNVIYSAFVKKENRSWVRLTFFASSGAFSAAYSTYFDLANGVIGSSTTATCGMEDWGDGWYRCWIGQPADATGTVDYGIFLAENDNDITFDGLNQVSVYAWGQQIDEDVDYPTSYVPTVGAAATRDKDELTYKGDDGNVRNNQIGTVTMSVFSPSYDLTSDTAPFTMSDGGAVGDRIVILNLAAGDVANVTTSATAGNAGSVTGTTDICDGKIHDLKVTWIVDSLKLYVDGAEEGVEDTTVDIPDDIDKIDIGMFSGNTNQINGLISNIKIYNKIIR